MFDANCEIIRERIDAFVDDELNDAERTAVRDHCARCSACARELDLALRLRDELRALPAFTAPAHIIDAAARQSAPPRVVPLPARRARRRLLPVMAAAVAVAAAAAWFIAGRNTPPAEPAYSDAEIQRARDEMELAFAYVDRYSVARIIHVDVMEKRVDAPRRARMVTSGEAAVRDALVPGLKRAVRASGLGVTSPAPERS